MSTIKRFRNRGDELRYLIQNARVNLESWERELKGYCQSISPVQRLPAEILSLIFEFYLTENYLPDNPRLSRYLLHASRRCVRRLLLVSRRWYQVAMSNPNLWNSISIKIRQYETDVAAYVDEITPYVVACLERSRSLPLHIELDLAALESLCSVEHRRLASRHFSYDDLSPAFHTGVAPSAPHPLPVSFENASHIEDLLYMLIGIESQHLRRWGTLDLLLPGDPSTTRGIWAVINGSAPLLNTLSVRGQYHISVSHGIVEAAMGDDLKDLHSLTCLRLREIHDLNKFQVPWPNILSLDLDTQLDDSAIMTLTHFRSLCTLKLFPPISRSYLQGPSTIALSLPHLTELYFLGHHKRLNAVTFHLPTLQRLYLSDPTGQVFHSLPDIRAPHIHFSAPLPSGVRRNEEESRTLFTKIATRYPDAISLTVHSYSAAEEEANLAHLKEKGDLPMTLETSVSPTILEWF